MLMLAEAESPSLSVAVAVKVMRLSALRPAPSLVSGLLDVV